jgi:hypothetical protein
VLGSPEAPNFVLEFVSYDCSHCRQMHRIVQRALSRYRGQVAVIILPYPQESECNKNIASRSISGACATARMTLGVARLEPAKFPEFHDWLMSTKDRPPSASQAIRRAYSKVGEERIKAIPREQLHGQIAQYVDLFNKVKAKAADPEKIGLPLMVVGDLIFSGDKTEEALFKIWEEKLGVKPVSLGETPNLLPSPLPGQGI